MKPKFSKAEKEKILSHYYSNNTEVKVLAAQYGNNKRDNAWFKTRIPALKKCIRDIFNESEQRFGAEQEDRQPFFTQGGSSRASFSTITCSNFDKQEQDLYTAKAGSPLFYRSFIAARSE